MKPFFTLVLLGIVNFVCLVSGDFYDITTVYKFNTLEESDENGNILTTYLNTCSVDVHLQTNAIGLPYFNREENVDSKIPQVLFPLEKPTIPSLDDVDYGASSWKTLAVDGKLEELKSRTQVGDEYIFKFNRNVDMDLFSLLENNTSVLGLAKESYITGGHYNELGSWSYSYRYGYDMSISKTNKITYLYVRAAISSEAKSLNFQLVGYHGHTLTIHFMNGDQIMKICPSWLSSQYCEKYSYQVDNQNKFSIYIDLGRNLKIYDTISRKLFESKTIGNDGLYNLDLRHNNYSPFQTEYKLLELSQNVLLDDRTIATPWIQKLENGTSLFVLYYRKTNQTLKSYLNSENTFIELESEDQIISNQNSSEVDEMVLTKFKVIYPIDWTREKRIQIKAEKDVYISSIWEGGNLESYKKHEKKSCVKDHITEIYDIALQEPDKINEVTKCFNGGSLDEYKKTCICPPGFTGDACEIGCGRNYFGQKCSKICSDTGTDCKGMILCTPGYGCSCAPGYHGDQCLEQCSEGTYGADCKETCGQCKDGCDRYTGDCKGDCVTPYLVWPSCKNLTSYWNETPMFVESTFTSVKLSLNFDHTNIVKSSDLTRFFVVQRKEKGDVSWIDGPYKTFQPVVTGQYEVENLKPGRKYFFRVLLVGDTLRTSDPALSKVSEGVTKCIVSEIDNNLNATKVTNHSIALFWKTETLNEDGGMECPFTSYILDIVKEVRDYSVERRKILNIKKHFFLLDSLSPGHTYTITLLKMTEHGESTAVSTVRVSTQETTDNSMSVSGVSLEVKESKVKLQWFKSSYYNTYFIKFRLIKRLSCGLDKITSPLQVVSTPFINYTLNLEPNALYEIFVTGNKYQETSDNTRTVLTYGALPNLIPHILKERSRFTNESVLIYWTDPPSSCLQMHGFFKKYSIDLVNSQNTLLNTYETRDKKIEITELSPKTEYKVRVRYVNHIGSNTLMNAEYVFITKATSFLTAENLTAYKTSANMVGIRWKIPENNSTITGIIVKVQNQAENRSINITSPTSIQCKAWLSYVCYSVTKLKQNTKYKVSVEIFSEEFPEGGSQKTIQAITRESAPNPVTDIKLVDISGTNITVSWRIPLLLNGILRKFQIEVEHLSSFDESLCCQTISTANFAVTEEKETYSHVIENIQNTSSYQVTIRAFTKRLGQETSKIIDIPPPILPLRIKPLVTVNDEEVIWENQEIVNNTSTGNELVSDILVIVLSTEEAKNTNNSSILGTELSPYLKSNDWWLAHICPVSDEDCVVKIGTDDEITSPYGEVKNKPLTPGNNYTIVVAQVNKYLSARSYTIAKSVQIKMKQSVTARTTMETFVYSTPLYSTTEQTSYTVLVEDIESNIVNDVLEESPRQDDIVEDIDTDNIEEAVTEGPEQEYDA